MDGSHMSASCQKQTFGHQIPDPVSSAPPLAGNVLRTIRLVTIDDQASALVENGANLERHFPLPVGLAQNMLPIPISGTGRLFGIARSEQNLEIWSMFPRLTREAMAGNFSAHDNVAKQEIDLRLTRKNREGLFAVLSLKNVVTQARKLSDRHLTQIGVVLCDQNYLASTRRRLLFSGDGFADLVVISSRQIELHARAMTDFAVELQMPAGLPGKSVNHAKAQPRSLTRRLRREEGFESARGNLR